MLRNRGAPLPKRVTHDLIPAGVVDAALTDSATYAAVTRKFAKYKLSVLGKVKITCYWGLALISRKSDVTLLS